MNCIPQNEAPVEAVKLRIELQNTLAMYNRACDDLIHAKKKVVILGYRLFCPSCFAREDILSFQDREVKYSSKDLEASYVLFFFNIYCCIF